MIVTPLDVEDEARYAAWFAALKAGASAGRHAPVVIPASTLREQLIGDRQSRVVRLPFGVFENGECLGTGVLELDTSHNTHLGEVDVNVPVPYRRRGVGTLLLDRLLAEAAEAGLSTLVAEVNAVGPEAPGLAFAARHGFVSVHTEHRLVLDLPVPPDRLAEIAADGAGSRAGYLLTCWSGATPPQHLDTMARLRTGMNAEVPTGDVDADPAVVTARSLAEADQRLAARGYVSHVALATAPDGSPAGYSLLYGQQGDPANAIQDDTYVLSAYRGRRLASWLKAANLRALQSAMPQVRHLHTWTDELNSPMQAINASFGFRPVEVMHEFQLGGRLLTHDDEG